MTLKLYKKRVHWYYTYHQVEYELSSGIEEYVKCVAELLEKDVIYVELLFGNKANTNLALIFDYQTRRGKDYTYGLYGNLSRLPEICGKSFVFNKQLKIPSSIIKDKYTPIYIRFK